MCAVYCCVRVVFYLSIFYSDLYFYNLLIILFVNFYSFLSASFYFLFIFMTLLFLSGLLALKKCIEALNSKSLYTPFQDSKLTMLLSSGKNWCDLLLVLFTISFRLFSVCFIFLYFPYCLPFLFASYYFIPFHFISLYFLEIPSHFPYQVLVVIAKRVWLCVVVWTVWTLKKR